MEDFFAYDPRLVGDWMTEGAYRRGREELGSMPNRDLKFYDFRRLGSRCLKIFHHSFAETEVQENTGNNMSAASALLSWRWPQCAFLKEEG